MNSTDSLLTDYDLHLLGQGTHYRIWEKLGAHAGVKNGEQGVWFAVWAPNAEAVSVVGDFNGWDESKNRLACRDGSGVWETFVAGVTNGLCYKFAITSRYNDYKVQKADPYAFYFEIRPKSAAIIWDIDNYNWQDMEWMATRKRKNAHDAPISIYEAHLGSWMRNEKNEWLTYRELAEKLVAYVKEMGFTHVEFLPVSEHPFDASWGYQTIGYFAPTSRFGTPQDFMYLVDRLHQDNIGVIVDWVPAHFPKDGHGLGFFDGTHLYEHEDPRQGEHQDWGTLIFNFGRHEVKNFLISNALFWLEKYHIDGLRVDAVASMLYLDYSRDEGQWIPNAYGGRENLEAIEFLKHLNSIVYQEHPDVMMIAEESTDWPMVSKPAWLGGLGFGFKWNMGWMHDTLLYTSKDPVHRKYHHNNLTFSLLYAFHENFILPFSHDEVVHGKGSMLGKMPGDDWQKFASLRLLYGYMFAHPGKKLLFMGSEIGQWAEWSYDASVDWRLLEYPAHAGLKAWVRDLNRTLAANPCLYENDYNSQGFQWIDCHDSQQSVLSFIRRGSSPSDVMACVFNFTPVPRQNYVIGVPCDGLWKEVLNSDSKFYEGNGLGNSGAVMAGEQGAFGFVNSLSITLPPLAALFFTPSHQ